MPTMLLQTRRPQAAETAVGAGQTAQQDFGRRELGDRSLETEFRGRGSETKIRGSAACRQRPEAGARRQSSEAGTSRGSSGPELGSRAPGARTRRKKAGS